ncbi:hypothetical protein F442_11805 [Phytophthora nicotianae P10297]|uniref:Uncharacterized protein n=1 Tax=Phytophthora nicotianae P10297 TaxID=1317064 RepID=W2Z1T8_PHYNI|nr:hypothetical protein F442_11805 [Phytophthora nicotianae P10297]
MGATAIVLLAALQRRNVATRIRAPVLLGILRE